MDAKNTNESCFKNICGKKKTFVTPRSEIVVFVHPKTLQNPWL